MNLGMDATAFEFVGGHVCLDFANTVGGLRGAVAHEQITKYADLVQWDFLAGMVTEQERAELVQAASMAPAAAEDVLTRALALREAIYAIFTAVSAGAQPPSDAMVVLNGEVRRALAGAHIIATTEGFVWAWDSDTDGLDQMLGAVARSAASLLTSATVHMVRTCASESCGWLFVDATKNHLRRWCSMTGCGNKARVRRHRQRTRDHAE